MGNNLKGIVVPGAVIADLFFNEGIEEQPRV